MTKGNLLELLRRNSSFKSLYGMSEGIVLSAVKAEHLLHSVISDLLDTVFFVICRNINAFLYLFIAMRLSLL